MLIKLKNCFRRNLPLSLIIPLLVTFVIVIKSFEGPLTLSAWDFLAFFISCLALYYAWRSYIIAKETLVSQQQTQKNTNPVFTSKSQALVLSKIASQLIDNFCRLSAMNKFLQRVGGSSYPVPRLFNEMYVEQTSIHLEIAYKDPSYFLDLSLAQQALSRYNKSLKSMLHVLETSSCNKAMVNNEMSLLIKQTTALFSQICNLFKREYLREEDKLDFGQLKEPLEQFIVDSIPSFKPKHPLSEEDRDSLFVEKIEDMLDLLDNSRGSDIYRSLISDPGLFGTLSVEVVQYAQTLNKDLEYLHWRENERFPEDWFIRILSCISYLYYKKELKDVILIRHEHENLS